MWGFPDSFTGNAIRNVVVHKPNRRTQKMLATDNLMGLMAWFAPKSVERLVRLAEEEQHEQEQQALAEAEARIAASLTPRERKEASVRFIIKDD